MEITYTLKSDRYIPVRYLHRTNKTSIIVLSKDENYSNHNGNETNQTNQTGQTNQTSQTGQTSQIENKDLSSLNKDSNLNSELPKFLVLKRGVTKDEYCFTKQFSQIQLRRNEIKRSQEKGKQLSNSSNFLSFVSYWNNSSNQILNNQNQQNTFCHDSFAVEVVHACKIQDDLCLFLNYYPLTLYSYLYQRSKKGPMSLHEIQYWSRYIVSIVYELHLQGYMHRDIKPDNIFLKEKDNHFVNTNENKENNPNLSSTHLDPSNTNSNPNINTNINTNTTINNTNGSDVNTEDENYNSSTKLKLENDFIHHYQNYECRLGDFESCKDIGNQLSHTLVGTYQYLPPEIAEGNDYDSKVDSWSIGVCCLTLLLGYDPLKFKITRQTSYMNALNIIEEKINTVQIDDLLQPWILSDTISEEYIDFIKKLLDKNPYSRISVKDAYNHPFLWKNIQEIPTISRKLNTINKNNIWILQPSTDFPRWDMTVPAKEWSWNGELHRNQNVRTSFYLEYPGLYTMHVSLLSPGVWKHFRALNVNLSGAYKAELFVKEDTVCHVLGHKTTKYNEKFRIELSIQPENMIGNMIWNDVIHFNIRIECIDMN